MDGKKKRKGKGRGYGGKKEQGNNEGGEIELPPTSPCCGSPTNIL